MIRSELDLILNSINCELEGDVVLGMTLRIMM